MADEQTPAVEQGTGVPVDQIPTDFRAYDQWRRTGELPGNPAEPTPAAAGAKSEPKEGEPATPAKTAPDSEPESNQDTDDDEPGRKGARERRIDRLTRDNAELQRRLKALEDAGPAAATRTEQPAAKPPAAGAKPKPDLSQFKTLEEYTEALTDWKFEERERQRKEADERNAAETAAKAEQDSWEERQTAARKAHPDYQERIESTQIPNGPGILAARQALLDDENGAEILYHLTHHPAELKRIAGLSPSRAILEIGKLSASISASASTGKPGNPKPQVSSAPKPPSPIVHGAAKTNDDILDEDFARRDFKGWNKAREAQLKR